MYKVTLASASRSSPGGKHHTGRTSGREGANWSAILLSHSALDGPPHNPRALSRRESSHLLTQSMTLVATPPT
ncbi:unnamed protein product [Ixodes pacificus]